MTKNLTFYSLFLTAITIAENAMIYNFIERLVKAKCDCSEDWRREAITSMTLFNFVSIMISLFTYGNIKPISYILMISLYSLFYFIVVLSYTHKLRKKKCECAEGLDANIIYYTRTIDLLLIVLLITLIFVASSFKNK